jgi:large subunit ribosomal protein L23
MNLESVLISPYQTEKTNYLETLGEKSGKRFTKYTFMVHPDANKVLVAQAIQKVYNVKPSNVRVIVSRGKRKRFRNSYSFTAHTKKAIVTFENGETLDLGKA